MEYQICEKTKKRCYSKTDAQYTINLANKKHWKHCPSDIPKRVYYCKFCKAWHLTKEKAKYDGNKTKAKRKTRFADERRRIERMETIIHRYTREYR